jgi:hypothetical protein
VGEKVIAKIISRKIFEKKGRSNEEEGKRMERGSSKNNQEEEKEEYL